MKLNKVIEIFQTYPTILAFSQMLFLIEELQKISIIDIQNNESDFYQLIRDMSLSHCDSGFLDVTENYENIFIDFSKWLYFVEENTNLKLKLLADDFLVCLRDAN
jgi:hypothetical protein